MTSQWHGSLKKLPSNPAFESRRADLWRAFGSHLPLRAAQRERLGSPSAKV